MAENKVNQTEEVEVEIKETKSGKVKDTVVTGAKKYGKKIAVGAAIIGAGILGAVLGAKAKSHDEDDDQDDEIEVDCYPELDSEED